MTTDKTDAFETAVQRLARRKNGDATIDDIWDLIIAVDKDGQTRHEETKDMVREVTSRIDGDAQRIGSLEKLADGCTERVLLAINTEHAKRHAEHMETYHALETEREDWLLRATAKRTGLILFGVITFLLGSLAWLLLTHI